MCSIVYIVRNVYVHLINTVKFETDAVTRVHSHVATSAYLACEENVQY
jgi:hypothetical protein